MNLAIEYALRNDHSQKLFTLPCGLFVESKFSKIVLTMYPRYGDDDKIIVRHWFITSATNKKNLPPSEEHIIHLDEIFHHPKVILEDYVPLQFTEQPYPGAVRQYSDQPTSNQQEQDYHEHMERFYNTYHHVERKTNWLWETFEKIYVPADLRNHYNESYLSKSLERDLVWFYGKKNIWLNWLYWKKCLLDFKGTAPELVFFKYYHK